MRQLALRNVRSEGRSRQQKRSHVQYTCSSRPYCHKITKGVFTQEPVKEGHMFSAPDNCQLHLFLKYDRKCTKNIILMRVHLSIFAVEKQ